MPSSAFLSFTFTFIFVFGRVAGVHMSGRKINRSREMSSYAYAGMVIHNSFPTAS
jgi:hypothetical protein